MAIDVIFLLGMGESYYMTAYMYSVYGLHVLYIDLENNLHN